MIFRALNRPFSPPGMGIDKDDDDDDDDDDDAVGPSTSCARDESARCVRTVKLDLTDVERLLWYETVFYELDDDRHGYVSASELRVFLSFLTFEHSADEVDAAIYAADRVGSINVEDNVDDAAVESDGRLVRWEFIELCTQLLSRYPLPLLKMASSAYHQAVAAQREERKCAWMPLDRLPLPIRLRADLHLMPRRHVLHQARRRAISLQQLLRQ